MATTEKSNFSPFRTNELSVSTTAFCANGQGLPVSTGNFKSWYSDWDIRNVLLAQDNTGIL